MIRTEEKALLVFERRIIHGIFGPGKDAATGEFRIRMNHELEQLYDEPDIVALIQARMSSLGHIYRMSKNAQEALESETRGEKIAGSPLKEMEVKRLKVPRC